MYTFTRESPVHPAKNALAQDTSGAHTVLGTVYSCTNKSSLCNSLFTNVLVRTATVEVWCPQLILTNESPSRITFMNRVDQSQLLKFPRTDRQTYCKLDTRSGPIFHIGPDKNKQHIFQTMAQKHSLRQQN
jgi:hypothetical protein